MQATRRAWAARAHHAKASSGLAFLTIRITCLLLAKIDEPLWELQFLKKVRNRDPPTDSRAVNFASFVSPHLLVGTVRSSRP